MQWIKTSERLPELHDKILFVTDGGYTKYGDYIPHWSGESVFQGDGNGYFPYEVPYWMPYPELPTEEE